MPLTQAGGDATRAAPAAKVAKAADEKLERFNSNHFGPGERHGQFAPKGEAGDENGSIIPVASIDPKKIIALGTAIARWIQRARKLPENATPANPGEGVGSAGDLPKAPSAAAEAGAVPSEPKSPPSEGAPPGIGHNSPPLDEAMPQAEPKPAPPDEPYKLPSPTSRSDSYNAGTDVAEKLKEAIENGWHDVAQQVAEVADAAHRIANQIPNIIADVDFAQGAPYDLQILIDNTKGPSQPGYEDHHIVPAQRGTEDKGLRPDDEKRLEDDKNFVRIPKYVHQRITNYYRTPIDNPPFNGKSPTDYLHDKNFDERYKFGLGVLRNFGAIK
jgi:hypothetical protein